MSSQALKEQPINNVKFKEGDLRLAEFARPSYRILVPEGFTMEDVVRPECWANLGEKLKGKNDVLFPVVELVWRDGTRYAELLVLDSGRMWAKVHVLRDVDLSGTAAEIEALHADVVDARFGIKWNGPSAKFCITRLSDNVRLHDGCATRDEAQKWLMDYMKALG